MLDRSFVYVLCACVFFFAWCTETPPPPQHRVLFGVLGAVKGCVRFIDWDARTDIYTYLYVLVFVV